MKKPASLDIRAADVPEWNGPRRRLVGADPDTGIEWVIRWCGNGQYSHWVLCRLSEDADHGFYVFAHPRPSFMDEPLIQQIEAAEKKYGIYC